MMAGDENVNTKLRDQETEWLKRKIQNALSSAKFCGLCLESDDILSSVEVELVIGKQAFSKSLQDLINYVFNDDIENFMSASLLCDKCVEKVIQAYLFIHNSKQLSRVINNCIADLYSKVVDLHAQIKPDLDYENANIMIILENDTELCGSIIDTDITTEVVPTAIPIVKLMKTLMNHEKAQSNTPNQNQTQKVVSEINKVVKIPAQVKERNVIKSEKPTPTITLKEGKLVVRPLSSKNLIPQYNTYKCSDCSEIFTSYRSLKEHEKAKHKTLVYRCELCNKCYNTLQYLNIHYKTHEVEKCRVCQLILPEDKLMDHLRVNHANVVYPCNTCELVYYTQESHDTHCNISHTVNNIKAKTQCIMCLKSIAETEHKTHKCKFSCPECIISTPSMPCVHISYLMSFRDQFMNHVNKIKCLDCEYTTRRKEHLISHVNREHLDHHPFTCADCGQQFYTKLSLKTHIVQFHQDLCCEYCDFVFKDNKTLESHRKACKQTIRAFGCHLCNASFDLDQELERHHKLKHSEGVNACTLCKSKFITNIALEDHHARVHGGIQCKKRRKHIECTLCDIFFNNVKELLEHEKQHDPEETFPCKVCPKEFDSLKRLYIHNHTHYTVRVKCSACNKRVASSFYLQHAARCSHQKDKVQDHVCEVCGKTFHLETQLRVHQKVHLASEPCPECNKVLKPNSLKKHMEVAHGHTPVARTRYERKIPGPIKTLQCNLCGHIVRKKTDLEAHMNRYHLKIKPFACDICKKRFCGKTRLKDHMATHSEQNNCFCPVCDKKFANRVCLKMHYRMHTGEMPYACDICGQKFRSSSMMKTHRLKKHLEKTVSCPLCDNMFFMVREMRHHFKKVHWKHKDRPFDPREVSELGSEHYHLFEDGRLPKVNDGACSPRIDADSNSGCWVGNTEKSMEK